MHTQGQIQTHHPIAIDETFMVSLPDTLGRGERESIVICKRLTALFVSNEKRVTYHCKTYRIRSTNLSEILRTLWELDILNVTDVRRIITEIEIEDSQISI